MIKIEKRNGIECPRCGCKDVPVQRTVRQPMGKTLRYRKCRHCGRSFATIERTVGSL